jgi:hypothetical protein
MNAIATPAPAERSIWGGLLHSFRRTSRANAQQGRAEQRRRRSACSANFEKGMTFYLWARHRGSAPDVQDVMARFEVSRATAYRWLEVYKRLAQGAPL